MSNRRRPLHTCGASILTISHKAFTKSKEFNGPIGSMMRRIAAIAALFSPLVEVVLHQWLAFLSFFDDYILAFENIIEKLLPPSAYVFNKIDKLIQSAEILPGKFDDVMNDFPTFIRQVPFVGWALFLLFSWIKFLNFIISTITDSGLDYTKEKEIMIDINCNELRTESAYIDRGNYSLDSPVKSENREKFSAMSDHPLESPVKRGDVNMFSVLSDAPLESPVKRKDVKMFSAMSDAPLESPVKREDMKMVSVMPDAPLESLVESEKVKKVASPLQSPVESEKVKKVASPLQSPVESEKVEKVASPLQSPVESEKVEKVASPLQSPVKKDNVQMFSVLPDFPLESPLKSEKMEKVAPISDPPPESPVKNEAPGNFSLMSDAPQAETKTVGLTESSLKEVFEKGTEERAEKDCTIKEATEGKKKTYANKSDEDSALEEHRLLQLFERGWHV